MSVPKAGRVVIFGRGGISHGVASILEARDYGIAEIPHVNVDVRDRDAIDKLLRATNPDWVINCAGISDQHGESAELIMATNLLGAINVTEAALATWSFSAGGPMGIIHIASTAGLIAPQRHAYYGASKAGLIRYVESMGAGGFPVWCVSPGRVDTPLREADYPGEDTRTRLKPFQVGLVVADIIAMKYAPGANVVIRKVGFDRVDTFEEVNPWKAMPSRI